MLEIITAPRILVCRNLSMASTAAGMFQGEIIIIKKATLVRVWLMLALPIFPGRHQPSIVGANELNFCVRDGNRWTLIAINTNYG